MLAPLLKQGHNVNQLLQKQKITKTKLQKTKQKTKIKNAKVTANNSMFGLEFTD